MTPELWEAENQRVNERIERLRAELRADLQAELDKRWMMLDHSLMDTRRELASDRHRMELRLIGIGFTFTALAVAVTQALK